MGRRQDREVQLEAELETARRRVAELEADLQSRTDSDRTTGLLDLRNFRVRLDSELARVRRHDRLLSIAVIDLDGFRSLNARHGYAAGDELLVATTQVLKCCTRASDVVARTGSDEFAILMPEVDTAAAAKCLERVMLELEVVSTNEASCVSVSAGIAGLRRDQSPAQLLGTAHQALDRARAEGGGRATVAEDGDVDAGTDYEHLDVVTGLASTLLERDRYTGEHSESVVELATQVAKNLGLDEDVIERIRVAALLHDIGKVAIPDAVLQKPAGLTPAEWELMREHPVIGERILRATPGFGLVARIVRHEHERYDGSGYPDGLSGVEIPIGSRIILAADAYHAMTSDRPYRSAMPHAEAFEELQRGAGTQFDPDVVAALVGALYGQRQAGAATAAP